jgi:gamma-glutamyltranspeptidase/glutathione hydrolase
MNARRAPARSPLAGWKPALLAGLMMAGGWINPSFAEKADPGFGRGDRVSGQIWASRSPVVAPHGAAATAHPLATQIAIDVLKKGGSAVDAAIAANAALGLLEPVSNGMGGDLFAIVWDPKTKKLYGYNGSGRSAKGLSLAELRKVAAAKGNPEHIPSYGVASVTVPGTVDAWFALHERFGKLPMKDLLAPAIQYAEEGAPVPQTIAAYYAGSQRALERAYKNGVLEEIDNARKTWWPEGKPPAENSLFKNPDLARTLRLIAEGGRDEFYKGRIARTIDAYFKRIHGWLRYEDFAAHHGEWTEPLCVPYRSVQVCELGPNTQGVAALQMLQILEGFDLKSMGFLSADSLHVQIEAKRLAFEDRARLYADPSYSKIDIRKLLDPAYAAKRRALIKMDHAMERVPLGMAPPAQGDTTYFTTADKDGMMVSIIQSNYRGMGSGLVADGLGFMFQDRGELFALQKGQANTYAPGKRPFHTIIPAFALKDGQPWLAFGVMGGDMQPQGHVQIIVNLIDYGLDLQAAGDAARWHHEGSSEPTGEGQQGQGWVRLESGVPAAVRAELERRGHVLKEADGGFGGYQAIMRDAAHGTYVAASEMRKDGAADGY